MISIIYINDDEHYIVPVPVYKPLPVVSHPVPDQWPPHGVICYVSQYVEIILRTYIRLVLSILYISKIQQRIALFVVHTSNSREVNYRPSYKNVQNHTSTLCIIVLNISFKFRLCPHFISYFSSQKYNLYYVRIRTFSLKSQTLWNF